MPVFSIGIAADEQREERKELMRRFHGAPIIVSSDAKSRNPSPAVSHHSDEDQPMPDPDGDGTIAIGPTYAPVETVEYGATGVKPFAQETWPQQMARQAAMAAKPIPEWATEADQLMFNLGLEDLQWSEFQERMLSETAIQFNALEQQCFEKCSVAPAPTNSVMVGTVLVVWTDTLITTCCDDP
jgi:GH24 family phage-related lysozyme (muramidase)